VLEIINFGVKLGDHLMLVALNGSDLSRFVDFVAFILPLMTTAEVFDEDCKPNLDQFPNLVDHIGRETVDRTPLDKVELDVLESFTHRVNELSELVVPYHAWVLNFGQLG
jgi:hypothetical protein